MIELILSGLIVVVLAYHAYSEKLHKEKEDKLINAIMAKNATELRDLEIAKNTKIEMEPSTPPDLEPLENLTNDEHFKMIMKQAQERSQEDGQLNG